MHVCMYMDVCIVVKLATVVEGDQKAPFFNSYYTEV